MTEYIRPTGGAFDASEPAESMHEQHIRIPELLAPAGSPEALEAALEAGADAVYLGGSRFNARMNAHNFDAGQLREAITHAHHVGGRVYLTLNTLLWDKELPDAVAAAYEAATAGVDALIIADLGAAALIKRALPGLPLHASTQLSGHNARMGEALAPFGFSRFVIARETQLDDLYAAVRHNSLEVEVFVHGAICVSHSGQCLFSSMVGGRSGNRGECAQPCRLPYGCAGCETRRPQPAGKNRGGKNRPAPPRRERAGTEETYPLSLKDLSLAAHVPALIEAGVSSLKIEGRMKSPGYVSGVVGIWRRLLDEGRGATAEEVRFLADLFSRDGFTDGYQTGRVDHGMMGIRRDADKERTAAVERDALAVRHPAHLPLSVTLTAREDEPLTLTAEAPLYRQGTVDPAMGAGFEETRLPRPSLVTVTVTGEAPLPSAGLALTAEIAEKQFSRTGGTPYRLAELRTDIGEAANGQALFVPVSRLNALRRELTDALDAARAEALPHPAEGYTPLSDGGMRALVAETVKAVPRLAAMCTDTTARFRSPEQITPEAVDYFDLLFLPLGQAFPSAVPTEKRGYILPPVIFDRDAEEAVGAVTTALEGGVRRFMVGNYGHLSLVREAEARRKRAQGEMVLHGDFRLGVTNTPALARALAEGLSDVILSPELTLPRMRDIARDIGRPASTISIVYGRLPLMLLEKCAIREIYRDRDPAAVCRAVCERDEAILTDRMGKKFPVLRESFPRGEGHRNVVYNCLPISMSDLPADLARAEIDRRHFIFTVESPAEVDAVISAYRKHKPLSGEVRRMVK